MTSPRDELARQINERRRRRESGEVDSAMAGSSPGLQIGVRFMSWPLVAVPFFAALIFIAVAFSIDAHADYYARSGHVSNVLVFDDSPSLVQLALYLREGGYVNVSWAPGIEGSEFLLVPRPSASDFSVGDRVTATIYAGSAIDLTIDHGGRVSHYTSSFFQAKGGAAAQLATGGFTVVLVGAVVAVILWLLLVVARSIGVMRHQGWLAAVAATCAATAFVPYLALASLVGVGGGHGGGVDSALRLLVPLSIVGLLSVAVVLAIFVGARNAGPAVRAELRQSSMLAGIGAVPWLVIASLLLLVITSGPGF
jgi:hypothetical protein